MLVQCDNDLYRVTWSHNVYYGVTICTIFNTEIGWNVKFSEGIATLHPNDKYNKNIGRKVSLREALRPVKEKNRRLNFWAAYKRMRHGKI